MSHQVNLEELESLSLRILQEISRQKQQTAPSFPKRGHSALSSLFSHDDVNLLQQAQTELQQLRKQRHAM